MDSDRFRKFTILHSNDMHGDFLAEANETEDEMIGGLALLSGYINKVKREEENVIYAIAGDMIQGSLICSEFRGISTILIMNRLNPDVVTLGNHELDYGLPHLLFLDKMAIFPIVNANLYIKKLNKRIMHPFEIINVAGFDIMFIGIITENVIDTLRMDRDIGTFVTLEEARRSIGKICNAYKDEDIDLTVLLTHIGHDADKELAAMLDPAWGVDMIIGGHSHTFLEKPETINNILIAQAGVGTDQIGRFDIVVDDDTNSIVKWEWQLVEINENTAEPDIQLRQFIRSYQKVIDDKYDRIICNFPKELTNPRWEEETALGNLFADILASCARVDVALLGSPSLRGTELGPLVTAGDLMNIYPYDGPLFRVSMTGIQLHRIFSHIMRYENRDGNGINFQVNGSVRAVYNDTDERLEILTINGNHVKDNRYTICLEKYHKENAEQNLGLHKDELTAIDEPEQVATSIRDVLEEFLGKEQDLHREVEGRLVYR